MTTDAGSDSWYYDTRSKNQSGSRNPAYVWSYGTEAWCNLSGQYVHLVADLTHLIPPYTMSICSIGIMGASYVRDSTLPERIELAQGQSYSLVVPHIYDEHMPTVSLEVNLRLVDTLGQLPFVTVM